MVAKFSRKRLTLPMAPLAGVVVGIVTAAIFALIPADMLGRMILRSGIPAIVAAAEPPLGATARIVLILLGGGTIALLGWFAVFLLVGSRTIALGGDEGDDATSIDPADPVPVLRRADAHPDAPARRPVFANRDLGTPFLEVRARHQSADDMPLPIRPDWAPRDIPVDLDLPMSAFDPGAIQAVPEPMPPPPPPSLASLSPRRQVFEPGERFETFELTPMVRPDSAQLPVSPPPPREPRTPRDTQATITALLDRLERGVSDRSVRVPPRDDGLQETLGTLRRMATRS